MQKKGDSMLPFISKLVYAKSISGKTLTLKRWFGAGRKLGGLKGERQNILTSCENKS